MRFITMIPIKFTNKELKFGDTFTPKNEAALKGLLSEGKVKLVADVMTEKYTQLTDWLHSYDLIGNEIRDTLSSLYEAIQRAIEDMDSAFYAEDLTAFQDALDRVRSLYTEALLKCGRKVAVRVYSEILQTYLWVVETDQDMHSLRSKGVKEAIYSTEEIQKLKDLDNDSLREIHIIKETFPESNIEEIKKKC